MDFHWPEYLQMAKCLKDHDGKLFSQEAALRSAISRSYFATFCCARNYARDKLDFHPQYTAEDHRTLRLYFQQKNMIKQASALDAMRQFRNKSDYEDRITNINEITISAIAKAESIIGTFT